LACLVSWNILGDQSLVKDVDHFDPQVLVEQEEELLLGFQADWYDDLHFIIGKCSSSIIFYLNIINDWFVLNSVVFLSVIYCLWFPWQSLKENSLIERRL